MSCSYPFGPLQTASDADLQAVLMDLWNWQLCGSCSGKDHCTKSSCPWSRRDVANPVLVRYKRLTSCYMPEYFATQQALACHRDLLDILCLIKANPDEVKERLLERHFSRSANDMHIQPAVADQERAFNLAANVLLSVNCGVPEDCADQIEDCESALPWASGISLRTFVAEAFSKSTKTPANGRASILDPTMMDELTVKRLRNKAGLHFEATDDLCSHLRLDPKTRVVYIFGCTAVLEEMLLASMEDREWCVIPREMIMEVLHTIYKILFPPGRDSRVILSSLAKKGGFDKDFLRYTIERFRRDDDPEVDYSNFVERLVELHSELKDPSPRNWFERLFEGGKKSAERKMLMATTIGVFIAVTIGLFGLVIAGFQAWVGYQQWKHPVKD